MDMQYRKQIKYFFAHESFEKRCQKKKTTEKIKNNEKELKDLY